MGVSYTPNQALPYPDSSDLVKDGATRIADLATAIDTKLTTIDATQAGLDYKGSARLKTLAALPAYTRTANVILANANGAMPNIDGVAPAVNDLVLLVNGASHIDDGLYKIDSVGGAGSKWQMTRAANADVSAEVTPGMYVTIEAGTQAGTGWLLTTSAPIVLNTTALTFTQFPAPAVTMAQVTAEAITFAIALGG